MTRWNSRIGLIAFFLIFGILMIEKDNASITPGHRQSHWRSKSTSQRQQPHIGKLRDYIVPNQEAPTSSPLSWLNLDKKINTYYFTFYNWYFFQIQFVDLTYDSYIQFKVFVDDQLHDRWIHRVGFSLGEDFYPDGGKIKSNGSKCCGGAKSRGLNLDIKSNIFNLTVRQHTFRNMSGDRHDGNQYGRFWFYTPNRTIDDPENDAFKDDLTITTFNITYEGRERKIQGNLSHVMRHNQCFSFLDEQNPLAFKHTCVGGYGNGRLFLDRKANHKELDAYGRMVKSAYNLDNNRTRTAFHGVRSTKALSQKLGNVLPKTNWRWKGFKAFMQCFSKPEYYSKWECIQKERYVGLHFARAFEPSSQVQNLQDFLFYNGKVVPIHNLDYSLSQNYKKHKNITFKSAPSRDLWQPEFQINFTVLSKQTHSEDYWLSRKNEIRAYGFWSGWIDEGVKGQKVDFFNITGYIETTNSLY